MNSMNRMKKQKPATFTIKNSNIKTLIITIIVKLKTIVLILVNKEVAHIAYSI